MDEYQSHLKLQLMWAYDILTKPPVSPPLASFWRLTLKRPSPHVPYASSGSFDLFARVCKRETPPLKSQFLTPILFSLQLPTPKQKIMAPTDVVSFSWPIEGNSSKVPVNKYADNSDCRRLGKNRALWLRCRKHVCSLQFTILRSAILITSQYPVQALLNLSPPPS